MVNLLSWVAIIYESDAEFVSNQYIGTGELLYSLAFVASDKRRPQLPCSNFLK